MPGRHVHFADNITPSPSFSVSTLPSSAGPVTPSTYGSQYCTLPVVSSEIHRVLAYTNSPALHWDLILPPSEVKPAHPSLSAEVLAEPATNPPLPFIHIICGTNFPWKLTISPQAGSPFVTIRDLISGLYYWLRRPITAEEFARIPSQTMRDTVQRACMARCNRTLYPEKEIAKGVKRIDFLSQKTRFMGLTKTGKGSLETFQLVAA